MTAQRATRLTLRSFKHKKRKVSNQFLHAVLEAVVSRNQQAQCGPFKDFALPNAEYHYKIMFLLYFLPSYNATHFDTNEKNINSLDSKKVTKKSDNK